MNQFKAFLLMALLTVVVVTAGSLIGGEQGLYVAFFFAIVMNVFAYFFSDKIAIKMTRAKPIRENEAPELYSIVRHLSTSAGIPMPRIYIIPSEQPNAFATGRNPANGVVAVTQGITRLLSREELQGVLAHELAHIKNRDILISTIAAVMAGALTVLARIGMWRMFLGGRNRRGEGEGLIALLQLVAIILAPLAALLIRMAISRTREYQADELGAKIAGSPHGLANALLKLEQGASRIPMHVNESAAHMFIINPLSGNTLSKLFSTHPPIYERVKRLQKIKI